MKRGLGEQTQTHMEVLKQSEANCKFIHEQDSSSFIQNLKRIQLQSLSSTWMPFPFPPHTRAHTHTNTRTYTHMTRLLMIHSLFSCSERTTIKHPSIEQKEQLMRLIQLIQARLLPHFLFLFLFKDAFAQGKQKQSKSLLIRALAGAGRGNCTVLGWTESEESSAPQAGSIEKVLPKYRQTQMDK